MFYAGQLSFFVFLTISHCMQALQHHPRIGQVFHLHEHYTTTNLDTVVAEMDSTLTFDIESNIIISQKNLA